MHPAIDYWGHGYVTGYGVAGQRLALALLEHGVPLRWTPIDFKEVHPRFAATKRSHPVLDRHRDGTARVDALVIHATPEIIPAAERVKGDAALICHTVWETERIQSHWPGLLNRCDGVIVPTTWNADSFRRGGVTVPIEVVPHVARSTPTPEVAWLDDLDGRFVVYSIAAWSPRKAPWLAIDVFSRAFDPGDRSVVFILKTGPEVFPQMVDTGVPPTVGDRTWFALAKEMGRLGRTPEVRLVDRYLTDAEIDGLHQRGDCWLSLPHGEGWDLGAFDASTAGTPVITTDWGAPPLYLDGDASWLVPAKSGRPSLSEWEGAGADWAEADLDQAVGMLREIRADPALATQRAARQVAHLRSAYSPERVAEQFLDALRRLLAR